METTCLLKPSLLQTFIDFNFQRADKGEIHGGGGDDDREDEDETNINMHWRNNKKDNNNFYWLFIVLSIALTIFSQNSPSICLAQLSKQEDMLVCQCSQVSCEPCFTGFRHLYLIQNVQKVTLGVSASCIFSETVRTTHWERNQNTGMNFKSKSLCVLQNNVFVCGLLPNKVTGLTFFD